MRILIATSIFPPDIGGPATYVEKLASALYREGFGVEVVTYSDGKNAKAQLKIQNFPIYRILRKYPRGIRHILYFLNILKLSGGCRVIYAQNSISVGLPAIIAARIFRKKFVIKIVGDAAWERARGSGATNDNIDIFQGRKYGLKTEILRKIQNQVARYADNIIVPSNYLKNIVRGWGVSEDKISVVYNSVDFKKRKRQRGLESDVDIVLSVGRLVPWKGFDGLIEVMPKLIMHNPKTKLVIIGAGPLEESLKSKVKNLKLDYVVSFIGRVDRSQISEYFEVADIFVLNSSYEGLSHVILEAMTARLPVIATSVGGNPELIEDGINGFLVEPSNQAELQEKILELLKNKELQNKFIHNSNEKLKQFSFDKMLNDTLQVLTV